MASDTKRTSQALPAQAMAKFATSPNTACHASRGDVATTDRVSRSALPLKMPLPATRAFVACASIAIAAAGASSCRSTT